VHIHKRTASRLFAVLAVLTLLATSCKSSTKEPGDGTGTEKKAGGTFRIEEDEFGWEVSGNGFDPSFEYVGADWGLFSELLIRTLMTYNHRSLDKGGGNVITDLAEKAGEYASDHMSITYTLKAGIKFGPPVNREVTVDDIAYSLRRVANTSLDSGGYANYYTEVIKGLQEFSDGKADTVSGISTDPAARTITLQFTKPVYDMDYRMAMPASGPIPKEVADCFKKPLEYGQYVVSTGPYMFEGMDALKISTCGEIKKPSGFIFDKSMTLVRNPYYDPATDTKESREALPEKYVFKKNTNAKDIFARAELNKIDWAGASTTGEVLEKYTNDQNLSPFLHSHNADNATWYIAMNLTEPPFDDLHVRKAANLIMDKSGLLRVVGGPLKGAVAEHIVPPLLLGGLNAGEFDPYATPDHAGDLELAKAEMKQSKYDTNQDGICDAKVCEDVLNVSRQTDPFPDMNPIIEASLKKIGIMVKSKGVASYYGEVVPEKKIPLASGGGWGPDWPEPLTFYLLPLAGTSIHPAGNINTPLLGLTEAQSKELKTNYPADGVPSVDADIERCSNLQGEERKTCWIDLDKKLMNDIVPWIPLRWSEGNVILSAAVTGFEFDAFSGQLSFAHMGIDPTKQVA
jgi:peptide/nickel transport system substrate-binding protein